MLQTIDLRSDTITRPDAAMLDYMTACPVGDDVYAEDPEVNKLQEMVAAMFAKEAGLYVPTGTMANLIALMIYQQNGGEVIMDKDSHPLHYEAGGMARIAGLQPVFAPASHGILAADGIPPLVRGPAYYIPQTRLIWLENSHNRGGGTVYPLDRLARIKEIADAHGLPVHMDGARVLNASVHLGCQPADIACRVTSLSLCFSKGLGSPMGSILAGPGRFIDQARVLRKMLGGAMRQIGYMAGCAVYALKGYQQQMEQDHIQAHKLYHFLERAAPGTPFYGGTNIVLWSFPSHQAAGEMLQSLADAHIRVGLSRADTIRFVTSKAQDKDTVDAAIRRMQAIFSSTGAGK